MIRYAVKSWAKKIQYSTFYTEAYNLFTEFEWCQFRQITFYSVTWGSPVLSLIVETLMIARRIKIIKNEMELAM